MDIVPWKSFGEISRLRREMDDLFNRIFGETSLSKIGFGKWQPLVDISETDTDVIVKAELPGIDAKDVDVSITGDRLIIKGEKQQEKEEKEENRYRSERYYGTYQRVIDLPTLVEEDKTEATYKKGILTITLPKVEKVKKKQIKIKVK
ncbi:MAG: Hsp20/alpha crystallin family protein [Deltaproteobacteria bacterium]|jgi:HSP20 family protein|nr:Hsp20/alpha crystallin family protein [Deltaproteobacteria bacterium]